MKIEATTSLDDEIDDLSEHLSFSREDSFTLPSTVKSETPRHILNSTMPVPYSSSIQSNPFSRQKGSVGLILTPKTSEESKNRQSFSPTLLKLAVTKSYHKSATIDGSTRTTITSTKKNTPVLHVKKY